MGVVKLKLSCPQNVHGISVDPEPNWNFDTLLSEISSLESKLNVSSKFPSPFTKTKSRDIPNGKRSKSNARPFVMRVSNVELDDIEDEKEDPSLSLVVAKRFNCNEVYLSDDSDDDPVPETKSYLMNKVGLVEGAMHEVTHEHQLEVKEEIRNRISAFEADMTSAIETSTSALARVEKYRETRREVERKLDLQYQRKVAEALDNHLTEVQREHELRSQIEERRIRNDAAHEEAKRKEKAIQEEKLRQEKAKVEAEVQAKLRAEEAKRAALEAEKKAAKEAAEKVAAETSKSGGLSQGKDVGTRDAVSGIVTAQSKGSESDRQKKSQSAGNLLRASVKALNMEHGRIEKLKELDEVNRSQISNSNQDFSSYESRISRLIRQTRGTKESVWSKASEIIKILNNPSCPQSISLVAFAKKVVSLCKSPDNATLFACSYVIVIVTSKFPQAMDLLLAEFHKACIYTVPKHLVYSQSAYESKEAYYKAIGYREDEGKIETVKDYLQRVDSYMRLYGALVQTEINGYTNYHGLEQGWSWLAMFLNAVPANRYTAVALNGFLQMAGYGLYKKYKNQFKKILNVISDEFLKALRAREDAELRPVIVEIQSYLEDNKFSQEPEGRSLMDQSLSSIVFQQNL